MLLHKPKKKDIKLKIINTILYSNRTGINFPFPAQIIKNSFLIDAVQFRQSCSLFLPHTNIKT